MEKFLKARKSLSKNGSKGFTLVELIIVIVIIAILIAALLPAVIGAIRRANIAADQADARTILTAASVWATGPPPERDLVGVPENFTPDELTRYVPGFGEVEHENINDMLWDEDNGFICIAISYSERIEEGVWVAVGGGSGLLGDDLDPFDD